MVKKGDFNLYRFRKKDVELRATKPQWKNSRAGDIATIQCGKDIFRKRITRIHRGTLARVLKDVDYKRVFPEASTIFEAVGNIRQVYPKEKEFMAFELEDVI